MLLCAFAVASCATVSQPQTTGGTLPELQARSSFDLGCPHDQLRLYNFDERSKGVVGCGRRLTYVRSCQRVDDVNQCTWLLDTPTPSQQRWPVQVAAPQTAPAEAPYAPSADPFAGRGAIHVRAPRASSSTDASEARELPCRDRSCARFRDPAEPDQPAAAPETLRQGGQAVDRGF